MKTFHQEIEKIVRCRISRPIQFVRGLEQQFSLRTLIVLKELIATSLEHDEDQFLNERLLKRFAHLMELSRLASSEAAEILTRQDALLFLELQESNDVSATLWQMDRLWDDRNRIAEACCSSAVGNLFIDFLDTISRVKQFHHHVLFSFANEILAFVEAQQSLFWTRICVCSAYIPHDVLGIFTRGRCTTSLGPQELLWAIRSIL